MSQRALKVVRATLGARLRAIRKQLGLSQEQLGTAAKLSGKFIGEVERGQKSISIDSLSRVASALGTPLSQLCDLDRKGTTAEVERVMALVRKQPAKMQARAYRVLKATVGW